MPEYQWGSLANLVRTSFKQEHSLGFCQNSYIDNMLTKFTKFSSNFSCNHEFSNVFQSMCM